MPLVPPTRPSYKNLPGVLAPVLWHVLTGKSGSLRDISDRFFADMTRPPLVFGIECIPRSGLFVTIFNHYESPTAASWWGPLLITRAVTVHRTGPPYELHWVMAREWWYPGGFGRAFKQPLTRLAFSRLSKAYGFVLVPPVLNGDLYRGEGVAGVRHALALTRGRNPQLVGLAPEGHGGPRGTLKSPPPGAGLFLLLLTHETIPCLPVGWYEDEAGALTFKFGSPFILSVPPIKDRQDRDRAAATQAMKRLADLLPEQLWGEYRNT